MHRVIAVTTAPVSAPAQIARAAGAPARKQPAPARQRLSTAVLVVGTLLSLASLFGPDWALRAGVVIALASAAASCALAWRELHLTKRRHARDLLIVGRRHTEDLRSERRAQRRGPRHRQRPGGAVADEVDRQQTQIAGLRVDVSALRADLGSVRRQLVRADGTIAAIARDRTRAGSRAGPGPIDPDGFGRRGPLPAAPGPARSGRGRHDGGRRRAYGHRADDRRAGDAELRGRPPPGLIVRSLSRRTRMTPRRNGRLVRRRADRMSPAKSRRAPRRLME